MTLIVRELVAADLDGLLALYQHLHPVDDPLPSGSVVERTWQAILADPAQIYIGGFWHGTMVTACNAAVVPNLTRGARPFAVIENVVTAEGYRRHGFGSAVLQELLARCWALGCYKVMLLSGMARTDVHAFYDANGFDRTAKQAFVITAR
ncbi:MAG TPA: GNAT family N-acetyltransferase [Polyangiaceae bacterium]|nr:GNAT family N-acetyltransferase [Polyangiaceae bacterium]